MEENFREDSVHASDRVKTQRLRHDNSFGDIIVGRSLILLPDPKTDHDLFLCWTVLGFFGILRCLTSESCIHYYWLQKSTTLLAPF